MRQQPVLAEPVRQVARQLQAMGEQGELLKADSTFADLQGHLGLLRELAGTLKDE